MEALARKCIRPLEAVLRLAAFSLLIATVLVLLLASNRSVQAQEDSDQPSLNFLGDPLALQFKEGDKEIPARVTVRNGSGRSVELNFSTVMRQSTETRFDAVVNPAPGEPTAVGPNSVTAIDLEMKTDQIEELSLPLTGFLVVSGTAKNDADDKVTEIAPGTLPVTLSKIAPRPALLKSEYGSVDTRSLVLIVPFLISAIAVAFSYRWFSRHTEDGQVYAPLLGEKSALGTGLSFDPTKSWATLLTGVAALLTAFRGALVFPETRALFTDKDITVLALSFAGLLFVGPAVYNGLRWREVPKKRPPDDEKKPAQSQVPTLGGEMELKGYVVTLLVASATILGALLGQLALIFLLIYEIENANVTTMIRWVLWILTVAGVVYAILYVARGIIWCLREEVRWGHELREEGEKIVKQIAELRKGRRELEQKARRTREQLEKLENIRKELRVKREELNDLRKQLKAGTFPRELKTL